MEDVMKKYFLFLIPFFVLLIACAADEEQIEEFDLTPTGTSLAAFTLPTATLTPSTPATNTPDQADPNPSIEPSEWSRLVLEKELGQTINSGLAEAEKNRLYLHLAGDRLKILSLDTLAEITELTLPAAANDSGGSRRLALDSARSRLYLSGQPSLILDTVSLQVDVVPDLNGQLTPDPTSERLFYTPYCACRQQQCNTLILNANTLTGTQKLFPPEDPLTAPCVTATTLEAENQLLHAQIYNGVSGSNGGFYFQFFAVAGPPQPLYTATDISFGAAVFDPDRRRIFVPRRRQIFSDLQSYRYDDGMITLAATLSGVGGQLAYDPQRDRLFVVDGSRLLTFAGDLTLLAEMSLPDRGDLLAYDQAGRRLFLKTGDSVLWVLETFGGSPAMPAEADLAAGPAPQYLVAPDGTRFRVFNRRVYRSADTWQLLGLGLPNQAVHTLAISPNYAQDQLLLVSLSREATGSGLYRSDDGGQTWRATSHGLTDLAVTEVAFSPTFAQDQTIFANTATAGLFRSVDGGQSWLSLGATYAISTLERQINDFAISPNFAQDQLLLIDYGTLLRSSDGGQNWIDTGHPSSGSVAFSPNFAVDKLVLNGGLWRSDDGGQTWEPAAAGLTGQIRGERKLYFSPNFAADQTVYLTVAQGTTGLLAAFRSLDGGQTWQALLDQLPADLAMASLTILPNGRLLLVEAQGQETVLIPDRLTWGQAALEPAELDMDMQALIIAADGAIFTANADSGVFKSTDGGQSWAETGFPARSDIAAQARLAVTSDGVLLAAFGPVIARSQDGGQSWELLPPFPDQFEAESIAVSPNFAQDRTIIAAGGFARNDILRSADGGQSWQVVFSGETVQSYSPIRAVTFSPHFARDGLVYAWLDNQGLLRSSDGGHLWDLISTEQSSNYAVQALAISPESGQLYLGGLDGLVVVSDDGGFSWRDSSANLPAGRSWNSAFAFDPAGRLYLGTNQGLFLSADGGQSWRSVALQAVGANNGLVEAAPSIRALRFFADRLYVATAGGGLFTAEAVIESEPVAVSPTPTQPRSCPIKPRYFSVWWLDRLDQLGCPTFADTAPDGTAAELLIASQPFENGLMVWRSDRGEIYALPLERPYLQAPDTWDASGPEYSCPEQAISETPPTPKRGFGKVWCDHPDLRQQLGQATAAEQIGQATLQTFEFGLIFALEGGGTYLLDYQTQDWARLK